MLQGCKLVHDLLLAFRIRFHLVDQRIEVIFHLFIILQKLGEFLFFYSLLEDVGVLLSDSRELSCWLGDRRKRF